MKKLICLLAVCTGVASAEITAEQRLKWFTPQSLKEAPLKIEVVRECETNGANLVEFFFSGGEFNGAPSRIHAFYARPLKKGKFPGVVQLHGAGLQTLGPNSAIFYATNDFCCISIDWCGPAKDRKNPRVPPYSEFNETGKMARGHEVKPGEPKPAHQFHTVGIEGDGIRGGVLFVRRAVMLLQARPEVEKDKLFLSGMSAGAHLSLLVLGVEPAFKGAVVKYGTAFIRDMPGYFGGYFGPLYLCSKEQQDAWLDVFEPRHNLPNYKASVLLLSGTDDIFFWMPNVLETYRRMPCEKRLVIYPNDNHSRVGNEIIPLRYYQSILKQKPAYPVCGAPKAETVADGVKLSCASDATEGDFWVKRMPKAKFEFRKSEGFKWEKVAAVKKGSAFEATVAAPSADEQIVAYLMVKDGTGAETSSDTVEVPEWPKWRGRQ